MLPDFMRTSLPASRLSGKAVDICETSKGENSLAPGSVVLRVIPKLRGTSTHSVPRSLTFATYKRCLAPFLTIILEKFQLKSSARYNFLSQKVIWRVHDLGVYMLRREDLLKADRPVGYLNRHGRIESEAPTPDFPWKD